MPNRCCVPHCKGNYPTGPKVSLYSFPKDDELRKQWLSQIQRKKFCPSTNNKVCELHFSSTDFEHESAAYDETTGTLVSAPLKIRRLKKNAIPTVFVNYPASHSVKKNSQRTSPNSKKTARENTFLKDAIEKSLKEKESLDNERKILCLEDVKRCILKFGIPNIWTSFSQGDYLCLLYILPEPAPHILCSVKIYTSLEIIVFEKHIKLNKLGKFSFPLKVETFQDIEYILEELSKINAQPDSNINLKSNFEVIKDILQSICTDDNQNIINFIEEQLQLILYPKNNLRYSSNFLIFASLIQSISPHAYNFLRHSGNIILPHPSTLRTISASLPVSPLSEQQDNKFLMYVKHKFPYLKKEDKVVSLMIDEVHIKPYIDYKGGNVVGMAYDGNDIASSAYVFMLSSVLSTFKEVVHILPVHAFNYNSLYSIIFRVVSGLEQIGFKVICLVTDNNAINRKAISQFCNPPKHSYVYPHPVDNNRPLFFLIDSVHLLKNIRNNWINQRNEAKCMFYPTFEENSDISNFHTASFNSLRQLHNIESNSVLTYAHGLTLKSLFPSNLERQNVKLVLKIFNKFVIEGLQQLGERHGIAHYADTGNFIKIILTWWDIMNVKTTFKGLRKRNVYMEPLTNSPFDEKIIFLHKFLDWLDKWKEMKCTTGGFSKETHEALKQTTNGMIELCRYCSEELSLQYLLPGKIQTDSLEERFGRYRQLAGAQYHISIRQIFECEKKLRIQSSIPLELFIKNEKLTFNNLDTDEEFNENCDTQYPDLVTVEKTDVVARNDYLPVITYLAGYTCYSILKKTKCCSCKDMLTYDSSFMNNNNFTLIKSLDRGGLLCPKEVVVNAIMYTYVVIDKLCLEHEQYFFKLSNQRNMVTSLVFNILESQEMLLNYDVCENNHKTETVMKNILWVATNIVLKNLCSKKNDILQGSSKKRKLDTLKS